jgi:hypothetical protein
MNGPAKTRETLNQLITEQLKRQEQSRADVAELRNRMRILDRKLDTRRKILVGSAILADGKPNGRFPDEVRKSVTRGITRPGDRAILPEFFPGPEPAPGLPVRPSKPPGETPSSAAPA